LQYIIGISDMKVTSGPEDVLVTYSLGSCVGVTVYDPVRKIGGMIHCMLPLSRIDALKAKDNPYMFTDTGTTSLLKTIYDMGSLKKDLVVKVAGAASLLDENRLFKIGERNHIVLRKVLWINGIMIAGEDTGGSIARTMYLHMADGRTTIKSCGKESEL